MVENRACLGSSLLLFLARWRPSFVLVELHRSFLCLKVLLSAAWTSGATEAELQLCSLICSRGLVHRHCLAHECHHASLDHAMMQMQAGTTDLIYRWMTYCLRLKVYRVAGSVEYSHLFLLSHQ